MTQLTSAVELTLWLDFDFAWRLALADARLWHVPPAPLPHGRATIYTTTYISYLYHSDHIQRRDLRYDLVPGPCAQALARTRRRVTAATPCSQASV